MPDQRANVSLDELLRAKREEKPNEAFWVDFDRDLKSKQRRLVQKQIVSDDGLRSPFAARIYRFSAYGSLAGFAAIALYFAFGPHASSDRDPLAATPSPAAEQPSFTVASPTPPAAARVPDALQEFAAVAPPARPRIVVERVNPAPASPAPANSNDRVATASHNARLDVKGLKLEFLNATGLFDDPNIVFTEVESSNLLGARSFEQDYTLGKYADPLSGERFNNASRAGSTLPVQNVNPSKIDEFLSSQSTRSNRSLDSVTLRF